MREGEGQTLGEWSRRREPMRDEGDMYADDDRPTFNCRALIILTVIAWAVLALIAAGIMRLFHYA